MTGGKCVAVITANGAKCKCGEWFGTTRRDEEGGGAFVTRAANEHAAHVGARFADVEPPQRRMFADLFTPEPEPTPAGDGTQEGLF